MLFVNSMQQLFDSTKKGLQPEQRFDFGRSHAFQCYGNKKKHFSVSQPMTTFAFVCLFLRLLTARHLRLANDLLQMIIRLSYVRILSKLK